MPISAAPATQTAKLFKNGRSQAVRLPKEFRFDGQEVAIRRDPATDEVILSSAVAEPAMTFDEWFALYDAIPDDAPLSEYGKLPPQPKNLTSKELLRVFDRTEYAEDFFTRRTSMPRDLDLL